VQENLEGEDGYNNGFLDISCLPFRFEIFCRAEYIIERVDDPKVVSIDNPRRLAIDEGKHLHIVYRLEHLYYAFYNGRVWQYEMVDSLNFISSDASIAVDSEGKVHISYHGTLKHSTNAASLIGSVNTGGGGG
jgi:hypothetical protein